MSFKNLTKSRVCRELIKEKLNDGEAHSPSELKSYVQKRAVEEGIVENIDEITPGIFSRGCQDTLQKENGKYTRDENGYKKVLGEVHLPIEAAKESDIDKNLTKILKDSLRKLNKEINKKPLIEVTNEDFESIQKIKPLIELLENTLENLDN